MCAGMGGFLPAMKQIGNVAGLPGIVGRSVGLPDVHSGYGFAIGNMAAFDMDDPEAIVSPGRTAFFRSRPRRHFGRGTSFV